MIFRQERRREWKEVGHERQKALKSRNFRYLDMKKSNNIPLKYATGLYFWTNLASPPHPSAVEVNSSIWK